MFFYHGTNDLIGDMEQLDVIKIVVTETLKPGENISCYAQFSIAALCA